MERNGKMSVTCMYSEYGQTFVISCNFHVICCWFPHSGCCHKYPGSLPYQVGVCATGVQSWAKEYCKHSDGQGIARMPQFRWEGSHFYLKHGYICLEKDKPLSAKMSFLAVFQNTALQRGVSHPPAKEMLRVFVNNPSYFLASHTREVMSWCLCLGVCGPRLVPSFPGKASWVAFLWTW